MVTGDRYAPVVGSLTQIRTIMSLENQTIGFICSTLQGVAVFERQFAVGPYRVDLCFPEFWLVVECDEDNHSDRRKKYEERREKFIVDSGFTIIRFNPNAQDFDLSLVLNKVYKATIFKPTM